MSTTSVPAVELLDVDNYGTWRSKMKFFLITKGLWTAVTGDSVDEEKDGKALAQIGLPKLMPVEQRMSKSELRAPSEAALMSKMERECWYCGKKGHLRRNCKKRELDGAHHGHGRRVERNVHTAIAV